MKFSSWIPMLAASFYLLVAAAPSDILSPRGDSASHTALESDAASTSDTRYCDYYSSIQIVEVINTMTTATVSLTGNIAGESGDLLGGLLSGDVRYHCSHDLCFVADFLPKTGHCHRASRFGCYDRVTGYFGTNQ
jgi:hypothetical protein